MIVTLIKPGKRGGVLVYADNKYFFTTDVETLTKNRLKPGDYIDEEIKNKITKESEIIKAKEKAFRLLAFRAHSKKELNDKLKRNFDETAAQAVSKKMEDLKLIDDYEYAKSYANDLLNLKNFSLKRIKQELTRKGINSEICEKALLNFDTDEKEKIKGIIERKHINKLSDEKGLRKTVSALQRLGYSWSDIASVLREIKNTHDFSEDF